MCGVAVESSKVTVILRWSWKQTNLTVFSLNIAQVKQKYGIIERENYNKAKTADSRQPKCPLEKEQAILNAFRHFKMI